MYQNFDSLLTFFFFVVVVSLSEDANFVQLTKSKTLLSLCIFLRLVIRPNLTHWTFNDSWEFARKKVFF